MKKAIISNADLIEKRERGPVEGMQIYATGENLEVSDGYHTFDELYDHRVELFIALCRKISEYGNHAAASEIWRSKKHSDGSGFDGWFVMGIGFDNGEQITYHLPIARWEDCAFAQVLETAPEWDKHTPSDVLERLKSL